MRLRLAYMAVLVLATLVARETVDCQHDIGEKVVHILQFDGIYGPILVEESDSDYVNSDDAHLRIESYRHIEPELDADSELAAMIRALEPQQRPLLEISDIEAQADSLNDKVIGHVDQTNDDDNEYFDRTVKKVHYNSPEENLKNIVEQKQDNYVAKLLHNPHAVADVAEEHSGYIFVKTPHTLTVAEGERLLNAMSRNILLPLNWFEEIKKNGNEMVFKVNQKNADPQSVIKSIISHRKQIEAESGLEILVVGSKQTDEVKIVSQSQRFKHELASLARSMHSRNFLITTVVICASLLLLLVLLLTIFLVRRRSYLRQKLAAQIMSASKDYKHDGSEKLIEDEESGRRRRQRFGFTMPTWFSKVSEKVNEKMTRRSDNLYTPQGQGNQRMHQASSICKNGQITPMNSSLNSTTMSGMADSAESLRGGSGVNAYSAINNTPVKMTGASSGSGGAMRNDSNRSSTSS